MRISWETSEQFIASKSIIIITIIDCIYEALVKPKALYTVIELCFLLKTSRKARSSIRAVSNSVETKFMVTALNWERR